MDMGTVVIMGSVIAAFGAGGMLWAYLGRRWDMAALRQENDELKRMLSRQDGAIDRLLERD